jgi:Domain of unknown function in PX-proteins (DUF3818)
VSEESASQTVELFIDLVARHEQAFYHFVHKVHSKGEGLFDSLMKWIELFLTFVREGLPGDEPISLEYILPHVGKERAEILREVDAVALYHYKLKVAYEAKVRRRFMKQKGTTTEEDMATQAMMNNVIGDMDFGSLLKGDTEDIYAEHGDDDDEDDDDDDEDEEDEEDEDEDDDEDEDEEDGEEEDDEGDEDEEEDSSKNLNLNGVDLRAGYDETIGNSSTVSDIPSSDDFPPPTGATSSPSRRPTISETHLHRSPSLSSPQVPTSASRQNISQHPSPLNPSRMAKTFSPPQAPLASKPATLEESVEATPGSGGSKTKRKKEEMDIQPPELKAIPQLLPVFVELVSCSLLSDVIHGRPRIRSHHFRHGLTSKCDLYLDFILFWTRNIVHTTAETNMI